VQDLLRADEGNTAGFFPWGQDLVQFQEYVFLVVRNQWEMGARNMTEGYNIWAKFTYAF